MVGIALLPASLHNSTLNMTPHPEDFSFYPGKQATPQVFSQPYADSTSFSSNYDADDEESSDYEDNLEENDDSDDDFALSDWKATLREDFESWLDTLDEIPHELSEQPETDDSPDLATVFGDLASLALENRKSNRRTSAAFTQWNDVLTGFQEDLKRLRERERVMLENQPQPDPVPTAIAAFLVDFHDRLNRLAQALTQTPTAKRGFFGDDSAWKNAWKNQRSALDITLSHLQTFLKEQGFQRIHSLGKPLDPTRMAVVETRLAPGKTPHTVIEETATGWLLGSRVLRPAQVILSIAASDKQS